MCDIPIFYATTEGQTGRIAERVAARIRERGLSSEAISIDGADAGEFTRGATEAVVVGASLHGGRHQKAAADFIAKYRDRLNDGPSAFFSVSLAAASVRPGEADTARQIAERFAAEAGWRPMIVAPIAGRLAYTQYGLVKRWVMRAIAGREGGATDTTRDHEYTDWATVDRFADAVVDKVRERPHETAAGWHV
jgi:menaquinone-dependent protoporphyrinogen oxidase